MSTNSSSIPGLTREIALVIIDQWQFDAAGLGAPELGQRQVSKAGRHFVGVPVSRNDGTPCIAWELCDAMWNPLRVRFCERPASAA